MGVRFFSASIFVSGGGVAPNFAQGTLLYGRLPIALDPAFVITKGAGETPPLPPPPPLAMVAIATPVPTASATTTFLPVVVVQDDDDFNDDDDDVEGGASQSSRLLS